MRQVWPPSWPVYGYVVVLQDTRGRYESGGEFYPFRDESLDGFDTVEWAAKFVQLRWQGWYVWRFLRGRYTNARRYRCATASCCDLPLRNGFRLLRWLDLSKWRANAMVHEFVDFSFHD